MRTKTFATPDACILVNSKFFKLSLNLSHYGFKGSNCLIWIKGRFEPCNAYIKGTISWKFWKFRNYKDCMENHSKLKLPSLWLPFVLKLSCLSDLAFVIFITKLTETKQISHFDIIIWYIFCNAMCNLIFWHREWS